MATPATTTRRRRITTLAEGRESRATQPQFHRPNFDAITAQAAAETRESLERVKDPQARLTRAVQFIADRSDALEALRRERDELALSAAIYDGVRGVHTAAGITRNMMSKVKTQLREQAGVDDLHGAAVKAGLPHREDWLTELPRTGIEWATLNARTAAARQVRNELVLTLVADKVMTTSDAAAVIGTTVGRVEALRRQFARKKAGG